MFTLARERDLDLDFHVDENGNARARGLRYVALKATEHGYEGRVVAGHCWCALARARSTTAPRNLIGLPAPRNPNPTLARTRATTAPRDLTHLLTC